MVNALHLSMYKNRPVTHIMWRDKNLKKSSLKDKRLIKKRTCAVKNATMAMRKMPKINAFMVWN